MRIPAMFAWPTPWFWLAIILLVGINARRFGNFLEGLALIIIVASLVHVLSGYVGRWWRRRGAEAEEIRPSPSAGVDQRLAEIERRLTDTQDVMIALSEKMDLWERAGSTPAARDPVSTS